MSKNVIEGIIAFARKEIENRLKEEAKRVVAEVVMETMNRLSVNQVDSFERLTTEIIFKFEK